MLNVGAGEITLILVVALLVLGPKRLPELARAIGKFMREFRRQTDEVRTTLESEFYRMDQDIQRDEPKKLEPAAKPVPHGPDAPAERQRILPPITGPLDGGRRVADELGIQPHRSVIGSAPPPGIAPGAEASTAQSANAPPTGAPPAELAGTPAPYDVAGDPQPSDQATRTLAGDAPVGEEPR